MRYFLIVFILLTFSAGCNNQVKTDHEIDQADDNSVTVDQDDASSVVDHSEKADDEIIPDETVTDDVAEDDQKPDEDTVDKTCYANGECAATEFCSKPLGSCSEAVEGKCDKMPDSMKCYMSRVVEPVCGCDGDTYSHPCWAAREGVVIAHEGECDGDVMCSRSSECGVNEFCRKKPGVCDMGFGVCTVKPDYNDCPPPGITVPVCGCNLENYEDECYAVNAGVSVKHEGECNGMDDSMVSYYYTANSGEAVGYLRIVVSPTEIKEFRIADKFTEQFNNPENTVTITVMFHEEGDFVPPAYAVLEYTLSLPLTLPMGISLGYNGSYLKWYDGDFGKQGEMAGVVITYDYVQHNSSGKMPILDLKGLNLFLKE